MASCSSSGRGVSTIQVMPNYSFNRTLTRYAGSRRLPQALEGREFSVCVRTQRRVAFASSAALMCFVVRLAGLRVCGVGGKGCPSHVARARFAFVLPGLLARGLSQLGVSRAGGLGIGRRPQPSAHCGASQAALSFLQAASQWGCRSNYSVKRTPVNRFRSSKRCGRRRLPQALAPTQ